MKKIVDWFKGRNWKPRWQFPGLWAWVKKHVKVDTWSKGEYFLGLALGQDEWSFELHLVKLIFRLKIRPAEVE